MNKAQREVAEYLLGREEKVIRQLEQQYRLALQDVEMTIRIMQADEQTPSRIHRIEYQERVKAQLEGVLEALHRNEYKAINKFLQDSYTDAFVGTMYDMHRQGVPMIMPMDQNAAVKAIQLDTKLSDRKIHPNANGEHVTLYESLGVDTDGLKETIRKEITRGLASNMLPEDIARNISYLTKAPLSRAKTIARTESHRIQQASAQDARERAKARGARVYKQWDSTLDGATRKAHKALDGQIVEIDKPFVYGTHKAMYPGGFGDPALDCNCRCVAVQRAAWALTEEELEEQKRRAETFGLGQDEGKKLQFQEFEKRFLKAAKNKAADNKTAQNMAKAAKIEANGMFVNKAEQLHRFAQKIQPIDGYEDFTCHADPDNFYIDVGGKGNADDFLTLTPEEYAERIKASNTYKGGNVRIISCQAGAKNDGAAQRLANALGVKVYAPTETVHVTENGEMFVSDNDILAEMWYNEGENSRIKQTGTWIVFEPRKE